MSEFYTGFYPTLSKDKVMKNLLLSVHKGFLFLSFNCSSGIKNDAQDATSDSVDIMVVEDIDVKGDISTDNQPIYPDRLEVKYSRINSGEPMTAEEITANTKRILSFIKKVKYFDYVLYTTHGTDAST